jgi:tRNA(Arg) A34 adenosine deaminase TadA
VSAWDVLEAPWQACIEEAWAAALAGCIPIGAVVTDEQGRIVTRGRNRIGEQPNAAGLVQGTTLAHAELNALVALRRDGEDVHGYTLWTTTEPCPLCLGAWYMSGVRSLAFMSRDPYAGSANLLGTTPYLKRKPMRVQGPLPGVWEYLIAALSVEFVLNRGLSRFNPYLDLLRDVLPQAVAQGERWCDEGTVADLRLRQAGVMEMVARLLPAGEQESRN